MNWISDDNWMLESVPAVNAANADAYFNLRPADDDGTASSSIVLFSGGLDSLSGAVRELSEGRQSVVLVSHRAASIVANRQDKLVGALKKQFGDRVFHVPVRVHMTGAQRTTEFTQRTRSFLSTAIATAVAELDRSTNIRFYENGVMSINLPAAAHYVGTRASRTTHPNAIYLLQDALRRVCKSRLEISNPYIWMTKSKVVTELIRYGHANSSRIPSAAQAYVRQTRCILIADAVCSACSAVCQSSLLVLKRATLASSMQRICSKVLDKMQSKEQ